MTPRQVDEMTPAEYQAFWRYAEQQAKQQQREMARAQRRRGR
ncbi:MAG TPA: hypothetical protein VKB57_23615 [Acidimicrobiales bacterium]|nr:hypothetical protein [Acidimicrobiales bacterium]